MDRHPKCKNIVIGAGFSGEVNAVRTFQVQRRRMRASSLFEGLFAVLLREIPIAVLSKLQR